MKKFVARSRQREQQPDACSSNQELADEAAQIVQDSREIEARFHREASAGLGFDTARHEKLCLGLEINWGHVVPWHHMTSPSKPQHTCALGFFNVID